MTRDPANTHRSASIFFPSLRDIIFIVAFLLGLAFGSQMLSIDSDLGRHLTIGEYIFDNRIIPTRDLFSHTLSNEPRPPYEWLSQILFALANRLLELDGVILFTASIVAMTFRLLFVSAIRRCNSPIIAFSITFLAIAASTIHWLPRPHIITFLLLTIWLERLEQLRAGKPVKWLTFALIMLFWANLHGGFVFGILAWCAYFAGWLWEKWRGKANDQTGRNLLLVGVSGLAASVVTPDLWHNWEAVLNNRSSFILTRTVETMPPNLSNPSVLPFTILLALTVILFVLNYKTISASHVFLLSGLGMAALLMARNIPLFVIACTPILSELAKASLKRLNAWNRIEERLSGLGRQAQQPIVPLTVVFLTVAFFASQYIRTARTIFQFSPQVFPVQAMDWLETHPQSGKMFNEFNWGGYILYRAWPQERVFVDSQSDFYGEPLIKEYDQLTSVKGDWEILLVKYQVSWAILPPDGPLAKGLEKQGWEIAYRDQTAAILVKP